MRSGILFITRNYPPKVGGLEEYSYHLIREFESRVTTFKITLSKSKKHLVWFLPYSFFKALYLIRKFSVSHVHLCDGMLAPVGRLLKGLTGTTVTATVHGLDITYRNPFYQKVIPLCIESLDRIVCVSRSTRDALLKRAHIFPENCVVIPNGVNPDEMFSYRSKAELLRECEALRQLSLPNRKILFTLGRLVKRKGVAWFVEQVMPKLPEEYVYLVAGAGPEKDPIKEIIRRYQLEKRVFLMGAVSNEIRQMFYNLADIFIMSNITVPGDVEGFGIVAIEAGSCGLPVVATDIQGIRDAVIDKKTGFLIREGDVEGFVEKITGMNLKKDSVRKAVLSKFNWKRISEEYREFLFS